MNGPASATRAKPHSPYFKLRVLIGTGLAPPKTGMPVMARKSGSIIDMNGSKCLKGFKVSLPDNFAVSSPSLYATNPWAISCSIIEKSMTTNTQIM